MMDDGTSISTETSTGQLPSPPHVIDVITNEVPALSTNHASCPEDLFLLAAVLHARRDAKNDFQQKINPYAGEPNVKAAEAHAIMAYTLHLGAIGLGEKEYEQFQDAFLDLFTCEYKKHISQLSIDCGADTRELQELLVFARTDKAGDQGTPSTYADERALLRAYLSLLPDAPTHQSAVEEFLPHLHNRHVEAYQKFYAAFEPENAP
ncbi:MAG TPA: hypothetical protein VL485_27695 [Ktedonobacteraceae bacterium]|nr:hypothetical protein [Ktedonobacteraceae bacterium]